MARLNEIERLEDIFEILNIEFDPHVLDVHRMRILRRFGQEIERIDAIEPRPSELDVRSMYATALAEIHGQCRRGMREPVPVFRGLSNQLVQLRRGPSKEI